MEQPRGQFGIKGPPSVAYFRFLLINLQAFREQFGCGPRASFNIVDVCAVQCVSFFTWSHTSAREDQTAGCCCDDSRPRPLPTPPHPPPPSVPPHLVSKLAAAGRGLSYACSVPYNRRTRTHAFRSVRRSRYRMYCNAGSLRPMESPFRASGIRLDDVVNSRHAASHATSTIAASAGSDEPSTLLGEPTFQLCARSQRTDEWKPNLQAQLSIKIVAIALHISHAGGLSVPVSNYQISHQQQKGEICSSLDW